MTIIVQISGTSRLAIRLTIKARHAGRQLSFGQPLERESVVNVSQLYTVDKSALAKKIGALSPGRVADIFAGLKLLLEPREAGASEGPLTP
jgi:mRNA-degrading endonuclease toxin of MazEF toxin-antitoxin module